ncbi:VRR-NUC domain-containing protein [Paraburkholderia rhynchosiae]|uniref:phosphodiesterase I n=1 Tax=Paraburkholderia rhynchosiae TaxID=487049 RepID=A0A2N7WL09_9BURK|nr:VRR-NUC domain-containing protein [Paraburkholderia rhynchosiae]PMS30031.1 nuclease [Paraburkholderia rhynchosiae]CAB3693671.1 Fanconi-associated nuclease 1 [Paraburkholderia rhynchosiae]
MATDAPPDSLAGVPYYLLNFERALAWLAQRYDDLLDTHERAFLGSFAVLPQVSRALLVRMLMRKGTLFRASRLSYDEIGCPLRAAAPITALGWLDPEPPLTLDDLFALTTRPELLDLFADALALVPGARSLRKPDLLEALRPFYAELDEPDTAGCLARPLSAWHSQTTDCVFRVDIAPLCERLRLMFFGNLQQDWSEFVLADLGVFQYEKVAFAPSSRAFQQRVDVDVYLALHVCRDELESIESLGSLVSGDMESAAIHDLVARIQAVQISNSWLETRRAKLLFRIGQHCERRQNWLTALAVYEVCAWPGARHRRMRVLERSERFEEALALASQAAVLPESEEEAQRIARMLPRLRRKLGQPTVRAVAARAAERSTLILPRPQAPQAVEYVVRDHLTCESAPVHYVENALINSLFGLLCWEPVFAALPGAFFHPFQRGPADLHAPDFHARRAEQFAACLAQLDSGIYRETIERHLHGKAGVQSPFLFWGLLTPELVATALDCLPAEHLKLWFERLLLDIRGNRSGLPDLIRFWPTERRYELIEVKGPGDRLQDNQIRWLAYCVQHGMSVRVLDVRWTDEAVGEAVANGVANASTESIAEATSNPTFAAERTA